MLSTPIETQLNLLLKAGRKTGKPVLICLLKMASPHSCHIQQAHLLDADDSRVTASLDKSQPLFATALCGSEAGLEKAPLLEKMGAMGCLCGVPHTGALWCLDALTQEAGQSLCFTVWTLLVTVGAPGPPQP